MRRLKNYILLILIVIVTVFVTVLVANLYKESKSVETDFYKYANTITSKEFDTYVTEYPNSIIYIYDKYSNDYSEFENSLKEKIEASYLKNNLIYIDKRELNKKFINNMKDNYNTEIKYNNKPIIIIISDKEVLNVIEIDETTNVTSINLEVFE